MNINGYTSCCVNPHSRTVTSNIKNTYVEDKTEIDFMFDKLRPVEDIVAGLKTPLKLAEKTTVNRSKNELTIAKGTTITVEGGHVMTVMDKGVTNGYEDMNIPCPGNHDDAASSYAAQDMAGALAKLLRDASGITSVSRYDYKSYAKWNEDVCKVLKYFGIDTSRDFTINGVRYSKNEDGFFESEHSFAAKEAYEILKSNNRTYTLADEDTKKRIHYMSDYFLSSAPEEVRTAWQETLEETGINPFQTGFGSTLQQLVQEQDFATGGNDQIFGDSIESSIDALDAILERIENPLTSGDPLASEEEKESQMIHAAQEKEFYTTLRAKLAGETETDEENVEELQNDTGAVLEGSVKAWSPDDNIETNSNTDDKKLTTYYQGIPMEEWAITDEKYTDPETGISWYVRDGKFPYMIGEDAEKFQKLCEETGEFPVKKFAEMTGFIRQLDENTTAYIGDNGIAVEGKDGRELFVDTSHLNYDMLMDLFDNLSGAGDYFDSNYWNDKIRNVMQKGAL